MDLYFITDRKQLEGDLLPLIRRAAQAGVDLVQIREKDLTGRQLFELCRDAVQLAGSSGARILVNSRLDVALAAGAHGVHLPASAPPAREVRRIAPPGFVVGVSCHSVEEVRLAASQGADFAVFGPVFETPSKAAYGAPQGLEKLRQACLAADLPVFALGGVGLQNAADCLTAGAAGIAGISLFQHAADLEGAVAELKRLTAKRPHPPRASG